jgi:hypothetical protein
MQQTGVQGGVQTGLDLAQQWIWEPLRAAWYHLMQFAPAILGALLILFIGGMIARLIEEIILRVSKAIGLDKLAEQIQLGSFLSKGGIRRKFSELIGAIAYWMVMLAFLMAALNVLDLPIAAQLFADIISYLPNVIAALFVLIIGVFAAVFLSATVRTAASNAGILQAGLLGQFVQSVVVVVSVVAALKQVGILFIDQVFLLLFAGLSLALGLAFGLGCKDMAGRWLSDLVDQVKSRKR